MRTGWGSEKMDSFKIHERVIADYRGYIESFVRIADDEIRAVVDKALAEGRLWPELLIQFNPTHRAADNIADLVQVCMLIDVLARDATSPAIAVTG